MKRHTTTHRHQRAPERTAKRDRALKLGVGAGMVGLTATGIAVARTRRHESHAEADGSKK